MIGNKKISKKSTTVILIYQNHSTMIDLFLTQEEYNALKALVTLFINKAEELDKQKTTTGLSHLYFMDKIVAFELKGIMISSEWDME